VVRALSIRQPYAEAILRGIKTVEYRTRPTHIIGERFYIYAAKKAVPVAGGHLPAQGVVMSDNLAMVSEALGNTPPAWMLELAELLLLGKLPTGVIVGSATISHVTGPLPPTPLSPDPLYQWHLTDVERTDDLRKPDRHPQPAWFNPFN
jgi:hypothetical protein